jgi:hypothetical protein
MKLNLSVLKNVLIIEKIEDGGVDEINDEINEWRKNNNEWVKNNIGDGEVSIKEWLDEFSKYWSEWSDDYGDSGEIVNILVNDYNLNSDECDIIMCEYWKCDNMSEFKENYEYNYIEYKN